MKKSEEKKIENFLKETEINNVVAIDVNKSNYTSISVIDSIVDYNFIKFDEKEKTPTNNGIRNEKRSKRHFFKRSSKILNNNFFKTFYKNIKKIGNNINPTDLIYEIFRNGNIPQLNISLNGKYSNEDVIFSYISLWFLNHRGTASKKTAIKLSLEDKKLSKNTSSIKSVEKGTLRSIFMSMPKGLNPKSISINKTIRPNKTNLIFKPGDLNLYTQEDNKEFYIEIISLLGGKYKKNAGDLANVLFFNKNNKKRKEDKRGECSFLRYENELCNPQKRGNKNNPYQELRVIHSALNISNEKDSNDSEMKEHYRNLFIKKINNKNNKGFIKKILIDLLGYEVLFDNNSLVFNKNKISLNLDEVDKLFHYLYDMYENDKDICTFLGNKFTDEQKNSILEYFEDNGSLISDVSDKFSKLYCEFLLSNRINITSNKLNNLSINKAYSENYKTNTKKILNGIINDIEFLKKDLDLYKKPIIYDVIESNNDIDFKSKASRAKISKYIETEINNTLCRKWTDPNVQQKMFLQVKIAMKNIFKEKINTKKELYSAIDKHVRNIDYIIETTRQRQDKVETSYDILCKALLNLTAYENTSNNIPKGVRRLVYETDNIDVYDGKKFLKNDNIEKEHAVPISWITEYGNLYHNLVPTKHNLNNKKDNNLPLNSPLNLNKSSFKKSIKNIYGKKRIDAICNDVSDYINKYYNGKFEYNGKENCYIGADLCFYHDGKKINKKEFKTHIKSYFKKKINVLLLESSKDELEIGFGSSLLSNISHSVSALTDVLIDVFGVDRSKIHYTPINFSYIYQIRKDLNLTKDRDYNNHHMVDCFLLLLLLHRKNVYQSYRVKKNKYKSNLNDKSDMFNYFKEMGIILNDDDSKKELYEMAKIVEDNTMIELKKDRAFKKKIKIDKNGKKYSEFTVRGKVFKETIIGVRKNKNDEYESVRIYVYNENWKKEKDKWKKIKNQNFLRGTDGNYYQIDKNKKIKKVSDEDFEQRTIIENNIYVGKEISKNRYQGKLKNPNATYFNLMWLDENGKCKFKTINKFDIIKKKDSNGDIKPKTINELKKENSIPDNAIVVKKKDILELRNYSHKYSNKIYIMNGYYKVDAIAGNVKITKLNTTLSYSGGTKAETLVSNKVGMLIPGRMFCKEFNKSIFKRK